MGHLTAEIYRRVCDILCDEWNPIGVHGLPRDEYDSDAAGLIRRIMSGGEEAAISSQLVEIARESMGLSRVDEERDRRVAMRLIEVVTSDTC
ncbi:MAG: hypothetical protein K8U57_06300 [Planctomycetes bacterium]|nr:hypothetical protein [Planctomycetota bacterium]